MSRFFVLFLIAVAAWLFLESRLKAFRRRIDEVRRSREAFDRTPSVPAEVLVRCADCGTYVPQSLVRLEGGEAHCRPYCRTSEPRSSSRAVP
jgi:formylmethanofuran dehydrogenase subunit E